MDNSLSDKASRNDNVYVGSEHEEFTSIIEDATMTLNHRGGQPFDSERTVRHYNEVRNLAKQLI